jgi:hypothetical protein
MGMQFVGIRSKWSQHVGPRSLFAGSIAFRLVAGLYLFWSAAVCIEAVTHVPAWLLTLVGLALTLRISGKPAWCTLNSRHQGIAWCAVLMLGSAYRLAGHASILTFGVVVGYWAAVLLAQQKKRK